MDGLESCCFIGHRFLAKGTKSEIKRRLRATIDTLIQKGVTSFLCGGTFGFGLMAGCVAWEFKEKHAGIKLTMMLPYRNQSENWTQKDQETYAWLLAGADEVVYVSEDFFDGCMNQRTLQMLESSKYCVVYLMDDNRGFVGATIKASNEMGITVINLATAPETCNIT